MIQSRFREIYVLFSFENVLKRWFLSLLTVVGQIDALLGRLSWGTGEGMGTRFEGDSRGIRGGFAGDSRGIPGGFAAVLGGFALFSALEVCWR